VRGEFLFLASIAHGDGVGAHVLRELGVDLERAAVALQHAAEADIDRHTITTMLPDPPAAPA
jgi:Clp amino terminal domain, pathogenicity island component